MRSPLELLPSPRSVGWLGAFGVGTVVLASGLVGAASLNRSTIEARAVIDVVLVSAALVGVLSVLGWLGARATFLGAMVGLGVGYVYMVRIFAGTNDGFADLAALAGFMMLGAIGTGLGIVADIARWIVHRRRAHRA